MSIGRAFFGESMFHSERDASKVALVHLIARLKLGGYRLLDAQFLTKHLESFGAVEVEREEYHHLLEEALAHSTSSTPRAECQMPLAQRRTPVVTAAGRAAEAKQGIHDAVLQPGHEIGRAHV